MNHTEQKVGLTVWRNGLVSIAAFLALLSTFFVTSASAQYQRPFEEVLGSSEQPTFGWPVLIAADPSTGDVLVGDYYAQSISRFHADGTPAPFAALGGNVLDGKSGGGAKPCAEEPSSCDRTPQDGIKVANGGEQQIAVSPTNGDIYLTQKYSNLVDVFSSEGSYLGQLTAAGTKAFGSPCGVAVDHSGAVYVAGNFGDIGAGRVSGIAKFTPSGSPPVNSDGGSVFPIEGFEGVCHMALGTNASAGWIFAASGEGNLGHRTVLVNKETGEFHGFATGFARLVAVDPTSGNPLIAVSGSGSSEAVEFDGAAETAGAALSRLIPEEGSIDDFATSASGDIYVVVGVSDPRIFVYGASVVVPTVNSAAASNVSGTKATLTGTVNPEGIAVSDCAVEWGETTSYGNTTPCEGAIPADSEAHPVHVNISGLLPDGHTYHYRLIAKNENGTERSADRSFVTANTVDTHSATDIGTEEVTLNGVVRPEGESFSECVFEYGIATNVGFEDAVPCAPSAPAIDADFSVHEVSAAITELASGTTYRFRIVATKPAGTFEGKELTFETLGAPRIGEVRALNAGQTSATLEAKVNPNGFGTSYRFEWGPTGSYGNDVPPDVEPYIGEGTAPVRISAKLSGLTAGTIYHYRVVATSSAGVTASPDQVVETLNSCGLPEDRCYELVSRRDAGPVATPGVATGIEMSFQAALSPGALAYVVESGYPDATKGAGVLYGGRRGSGGWESTQLSAPIVARNESRSTGSTSSITLGLSDDLSCGVLTSAQPLTDDPGTRAVYEAGGNNLYRLNLDGSYTAISRLAPENPEVSSGKYILAGASRDCAKVVFTTPYHYYGVPGEGTGVRAYEWEDGTLRNLGFVPGPGGEVIADAAPGDSANKAGVVSEDGSRVFFTATREASSNPAEIGNKAVFVREDGSITRDVSLSQTSTPDTGATYQYATPDGSKVFFTANAGLTAESSPMGTDLYEYDLETEKLTDLSVTEAADGAQVGGFAGASRDGSRVYFVARAQLLPGRGNTLAKNLSSNTYSLYGVAGGEVSFVGTVGGTPEELQKVTVQVQRQRSANVSPDGRYLLFESAVDVTGYESGGVPEVYLYDAHGGSEGTVCVSCRQDGRTSITPSGYELLATGTQAVNPLHAPQSLVEHEGGPRALFRSRDSLAPGAVEGQSNLYEWSHGQVFLLTSEPPGLSREGTRVFFAGASEDGTDLYFVTSRTHNWEDGDERPSVYDARVGGGFAAPGPAAAPCDADAEGSCQGEGPAGVALPGAASATFNGPGNPGPRAEKKVRKKKSHGKRRRHRKSHRRRSSRTSGRARSQQRRHNGRARHTNTDRRAGK